MRPLIVAGIPARRGSTRLAAKMLADVEGVPLVVRTWRRVADAGFARVFVTTDDDEIAAVVEAAGGEVVRTGEAPNGTTRVAAAFAALGIAADVVLNVQGDEPLVAQETLRRVAAGLIEAGSEGFGIATGAAPLSAAEAENPARVKVAIGEAGRALYFSRAAIPHGGPFRVHVGVYAFRPAVLRAAVALPEVEAERVERLEQLRWLAHGLAIRVVEVAAPAPSVDTAEDLERVRRMVGAEARR